MLNLDAARDHAARPNVLAHELLRRVYANHSLLRQDMLLELVDGTDLMRFELGKGIRSVVFENLEQDALSGVALLDGGGEFQGVGRDAESLDGLDVSGGERFEYFAIHGLRRGADLATPWAPAWAEARHGLDHVAEEGQFTSSPGRGPCLLVLPEAVEGARVFREGDGDECSCESCQD